MKTALIGCGAISGAHLRGLSTVDTTVAALCDIDAGKAEKRKAEFGLSSTVYTDWREMIDRERPDVVHVCTPHYLHLPMSVYALSRGINVLCEKPDAVSVIEAEKMKAAAEKSGTTLMVIRNNRYEDAFKGRLAWIDNPEDDSNRHVTRYYDRIFTTMSLWKLFVKTFTIGMYDVFSRPSIFEWLSALEEEQKKLRYCPNCKTDFLCHDVEDECPFCDDSLDFDIVVDIAHLTPKFIIDDCRFAEDALQIEDKLIYSTYLNKSNPFVLKSSDLMCVSDKELEVLSVHVTSNDDNNIRVVVDPKNGASFFIATPGLLKYNQKIDKATSIPFSKQSHRSLVLSLSDINEPQRVIILTATN